MRGVGVVVLVFLHSPRMVQWYWGPLKLVMRGWQLANWTALGVLLVVLGLGPLRQILRVVWVELNTGEVGSPTRGTCLRVFGLDYNLCRQVAG